MLPAQHRLRVSAEFTAVVRGPGARRSGSRLLVLHANRLPDRAGKPPRVGFVVSKALGTAVTRNRTKRRLRALVSARLASVPTGVDLVIRANPASGAASSADLGASLDRTLPSVCRPFATAPR